MRKETGSLPLMGIARRTCLVAATAAALTACGNDSPVTPSPLQGSFVGRTTNPGLFVGVATSDGQATAYLCDGASVAEWFSGSLDDTGRLVATSRGGVRIDLRLTATRAAGTATSSGPAGGAGVSFNATLPGEGIAGLFRAVATQGGVTTQLGGWVVLPDGQRGAVRTSAGVAANPALDTAALTATGPGGVALRAVRVTGFVGSGVKL